MDMKYKFNSLETRYCSNYDWKTTLPCTSEYLERFSLENMMEFRPICYVLIPWSNVFMSAPLCVFVILERYRSLASSM